MEYLYRVAVHCSSVHVSSCLFHIICGPACDLLHWGGELCLPVDLLYTGLLNLSCD